MFTHFTKCIQRFAGWFFGFSFACWRAACICVVGIAAMFMSVTAAAQDKVFRVDILNGTTSGTGDDWNTDAIKFLQDAIGDAVDWLTLNPTDTVEIWVAEGTYRPDQTKANGSSAQCAPYGDCDPDHSFEIPFGLSLTIRGGFAGGESSPAERDDNILANRTILSGDLEDDDSVTIMDNGQLVLNFQNYGDNSYTVVDVIGHGVFDRITVRGANGPQNFGSGVHVWGLGSLRIEDSILERNIGWNGGGLFVEGPLEMRRCLVQHNRTEVCTAQACQGQVPTEVGGGGISQKHTEAVIISSRIHQNVSHIHGGGYRTFRASPLRLVNVEITENVAGDQGGALYGETHPQLHHHFWNCVIARNVSGNDAAAVFTNSTETQFINCTIVDNSGVNEPGINVTGETSIVNSIVRDSGEIWFSFLSLTISLYLLSVCDAPIIHDPQLSPVQGCEYYCHSHAHPALYKPKAK